MTVFVILTLFSTALLTVLSVMADTPRGVILGLNASKRRYLDSYGGESMALRAENAILSLAERNNADFCYGTLNGVTKNAILRYGDKEWQSDIVTQLGQQQVLEYRVERHGYFVPREYALALSSVAEFEGDGVLLSDEVADFLGAQAGSTVSIGERDYKVLALFVEEDVFHDYTIDDVTVPFAYYYVVDSADGLTFDEFYLTYRDMETLYAVYDRASGEFALSNVLADCRENISVINTYYSYHAILLAALTLFLLYVLFTLFYRTRKSQICRFKLLGATDTTVAGIYLAISLALVTVTVIIASALSVPLSKIVLDLCTDLFGVSYGYHFRVWLPFAVYGTFAALSVVMFAFLRRKIARMSVAEEVRYE